MSYANSGVPSRRARAPGLWPVTVSGRVAWRETPGGDSCGAGAAWPWMTSMTAISSRPITPRRAAGCERGIYTSGSSCPRLMASSGGSVPGLAVSQPRPASARCSRIGENSASSGVSIQVTATLAESAAERSR